MDIKALNASKLDLFRAIIDRQADEEEARLIKELRQKSGARGKAHAEFAAREALAQVRAEENAAAGKFKKEFSRCEFETTKAVRLHRKELIEDFFGEIQKELMDFAKSGEYEGYLKRSLEDAEKNLGKGCVIFAAPGDVDKVKKLTKNEVRPDNNIIIGGISALDGEKGLFVELTLDRALSDEKEEFPKRVKTL